MAPKVMTTASLWTHTTKCWSMQERYSLLAIHDEKKNVYGFPSMVALKRAVIVERLLSVVFEVVEGFCDKAFISTLCKPDPVHVVP